MAESTVSFHREAAQKILLRHLQEGKIVQEEGATLLMLPSLEKAARVNVIATVLFKEKLGNITNFLIDDGTGKAVFRFFEPLAIVEQAEVGKAVLVIAKPRRYNQEVYLSPEIIKKVSSSWLQVRKKELPSDSSQTWGGMEGNTFSGELGTERGAERKEIAVEPVEKEEIVPKMKVLNLIKTLDSGSGVPVEEILEKSALPEMEQLLKKLLERGEIFQNAPGKVRVL